MCPRFAGGQQSVREPPASTEQADVRGTARPVPVPRRAPSRRTAPRFLHTSPGYTPPKRNPVAQRLQPALSAGAEAPVPRPATSAVPFLPVHRSKAYFCGVCLCEPSSLIKTERRNQPHLNPHQSHRIQTHLTQSRSRDLPTIAVHDHYNTPVPVPASVMLNNTKTRQ